MRLLPLAAFASIATVASFASIPAARAQDPAPAPAPMPGMAGGSYTRAMMMSRNDSTGANSIAAVAMSDPQFSTLVRLVRASGLDNSLMYRGPLTVFAPTNDAFDKLPKGTVEALLMPENIKYLQRILMYHIVPGGYTAADVTAVTNPLPTTARTTTLAVVAGPGLSYGSSTGGGMTGTARIVRPDIMASNGVIHVIDTVLIPPMTEMETKDLMASTKRARMDMKLGKAPSLLKEAKPAMQSPAQQLKDKPLGGSATDPAPTKP